MTDSEKRSLKIYVIAFSLLAIFKWIGGLSIVESCSLVILSFVMYIAEKVAQITNDY